jgi:mevalonate kinase
VHHHTNSARVAWSRWVDDPSQPLVRPALGAVGHVVLAVGEGLAALGIGDDVGLEISIRSELPIGAGLGSSAALAIALLQALAATLATPFDDQQLLALSLEVERRQHGSPSGIDSAAVLHGGILRATRTATGTLETAPAPFDPATLSHLSLWSSGTPAESTGEVVAAVRRRAHHDPKWLAPWCDAIADATERVATALAGGNLAALGQAIRDCETALEGLGVVPPAVATALAAINTSGGSAKISGAGALTGAHAGAILALGPITTPAHWRPLVARLGGPGARIEEVCR